MWRRCVDFFADRYCGSFPSRSPRLVYQLIPDSARPHSLFPFPRLFSFFRPQHLAGQMSYVKFVLPTAPTQPVTMNMGMPMPSWYDIVGLDEKSNEKCKGIEASRDTIREILRKEHENTGLPYSRMVLAGFSQGAALSLFTGLQLESVEKKLAGIAILSGYLAAAKVRQIYGS